MCRSLSVLTGLLLALGLLNLPASAATLNVPAQYSTIQAAINASANGDTVLISDGTYTGPGNVDLDFGGRNITVSSVNGAAKTIIDCGGSSSGNHRGFYLSNGETNAIIKGLTVQNGYENGNSEAAIEGAGIYDYNAGLTIQNSTLKNNTCAYGGGIYIHNVDVGKATVMNCLLSGNSASYGGGVYGYNEASGTITATGCTLTGNSGATSGGGFYNINNTGGIITIFGCFLSSNSAPNAPTNGISGGGGIFNGNSGGTVTIADCALTGNSTLAWGGGLNSSNTSGTTTVISCTFTTNKAALSSGGGVYISGGINLTDDIIYGDTNGEVTAGYPSVSYSDIKGGYSGTSNINADPLFTLSPTDLHLLNGSPCIGMGTANSAPTVTLDGRTRPNPPSIGAYEADPRLQTTVTLSSSLNPSNPGQSVTFTAGVAGGGVKATGTAPFTVDGTTQATVPLTGNGTAAYTTSALSAGAHLIQAIYSGDGNLTPSKSAVLTQTNGLAGTAITVSSSLNPAVTGQYVNFQATLTNSGSSAASKPTGTVTFTVDGTVQQTTGLLSGRTAYYTTSSLPVSSHSVTATYNGDASFAASVSSALTQTILQHVSPQYVSPSGNDSNLGTQAAPKLTIQAAINATLNGDTVIVEDGTYTGPGNVDLDFGGKNLTVASQHGASKTIIDCGGSMTVDHRGFYLHSGETNAIISGITIQNAEVGGSYPGSPNYPGGGILSYSGLTVQNCIFRNNSAGQGGGLFLSLQGSSASVINCVFTGNSAGEGGGIYLLDGGTGTISVIDCTLTGNAATGTRTPAPGGGIEAIAYTYPTNNIVITLTNDIIYGDTSGEVAGYSYPNGTMGITATYCDIQGGYAGTGNINADPLFVGSPSDLHLQAGSPCLGTGTDSNTPTTTLDGQTRPDPPSMGAYELLPAAQPSLINDTDNGLVYGGAGWFYSPGRSFGDVKADVHATQSNGDSVSFSFLGSSISVLSETNVDEGTIDVSIDGVYQKTINCSAASRQVQQTVYSISGLAPGAHMLKMTKTGGTYMLLDALLATPAPAGGSTVNDTDFGITYSGSSWGYYPNRGVGDFQDDVHAATANGEFFTYRFTGTGVSYLAETDYDEGNVQIFLDGALQTTVNCYSSFRSVQHVLWSAAGLASTGHTLDIVKQDGQYMLIDALQASPAASARPITVVNDTGSGITYTGSGWIHSSGRSFGDVSSDVHATTVDGSSVSYVFTGGAISWLTETNADEGNVQVYLDGVLQATVNCATASRQVQQAMYSASGLSVTSTHTLKLVKMSGNYLVVDAFRSQ